MSKLLCVIIDGLGADTLACAHVPCFDRLAAKGVTSLRLQAVRPNLTLPTLLSVLTSLPPEEHGVTTNGGNAGVSAHAVSLFSLLRYRHHASAAFYSNDRLQQLFPLGSLQTAMLINSQSIRNVDRELAEQASRHLQREKPDCCFLYLEGANIAGTHFGFNSEVYLESVEQADRAVGLVMEYLAVAGLHQDYVTMILGCCGNHRPGPESEEAPSLPLLLAGPGIRKGEQLERPLSLLDLAATMAGILGLATHPDWRGGVVAEVFHRQPLEIKSLPRKKTSKPRPRQEWAGLRHGQAERKPVLSGE